MHTLISNTNFFAYRYLHTLVQKNEDLEVYAFCDPGATFALNKDFESYVVNRLKEGNPDRLFLMPHNQR